MLERVSTASKVCSLSWLPYYENARGSYRIVMSDSFSGKCTRTPANEDSDVSLSFFVDYKEWPYST